MKRIKAHRHSSLEMDSVHASYSLQYLHNRQTHFADTFYSRKRPVVNNVFCMFSPAFCVFVFYFMYVFAVSGIYTCSR